MRSTRRTVMVLVAVVIAVAGAPLPPAPVAAAAIGDVLLADVGSGFALVGEQRGTLDSLIRTFRNEHAQLALDGFPVTDPPGVRQLFQLFSAADAGFEIVTEPSLALAAWLVPAGTQLGDGYAALIFAARSHMFFFTLTVDAASDLEPVAFVLALADRQLAAADGPPDPVEPERAESTVANAEVAALLPATPPPGYGLTSSATVSGNDELSLADDVQPDVVEFLNDNAPTATRVWIDDTGALRAGVSITKFPYEIFAAAMLGSTAAATDAVVVSTDGLTDVPDVVTYLGRGDAANQVGTAFRRGDAFVLVLVARTDGVPAERAIALAADMTRVAVAGLPPGGAAAYTLPDTRSKLFGLAATAALVSAAAGGSAVIGRLRARRVRRRWTVAGARAIAPIAPIGRAAGAAIALDDDAKRLRHRGAVVAGGQLAVVNVGVVALAGDFAWLGAAVAAAALVAGLVLTHWWQRRELALLGASAPTRQFVLPRPAGAVVGLLALAVLGLGVAYALKGLRYLVLPPSLAQLKWSDLLGIAPRTVGIVFGVGGFLVAILGAWLFRLARALGRAGTKRVLDVDRRPAALYLRSFDDDSLPLPAIASARRPLFELFSVRGTDPFEESVAWELNSYGPVVAVGRPGRSLASLGAAREHLSDDTWREQVAHRMDEAGIIAIATGETDGLAWELGQVVAGGHLSKTFFVFPPVDPDSIGRRWEHTAASLAGAGRPVGSLPVPPAVVHTVRIADDGTPTVTFASRRDEATYRTAVDRAVGVEPIAAPWPPPSPPPTRRP